MTKLEKFQELDPKVTKIKIQRSGDEILGWTLFADDEEKIGYGFIMKAPDQAFGVPETEEFDLYEVTGILDLDFKLRELDIALHEDYKGDLWAEGINDAPYKDQYIGLEAEKMRLSPDGAIDAISGSTISSKTVTDAIREKIMEMEKAFQ